MRPVMGVEPRASRVFGKHSINWATCPVPGGVVVVVVLFYLGKFF